MAAVQIDRLETSRLQGREVVHGLFLRYSANTETLQDLLGFLYAECCTRNQSIEPEAIVQIAK
jgi:hypothetical protein